MAARKPRTKAGRQRKVHAVMTEFAAGTLRSGSKRGPRVSNRRQAIAIALSAAGLSRKGRKARRKR